MTAPQECTPGRGGDTTAHQSRTVHRFLARPGDAGFDDAVGGGKLLEWVDKAAYACAARWSGRYCVTAYVGNVHLTQPIVVGDLVELDARVVLTGRSSMHILVSVYSTDPTLPTPTPVSQCLTVFVAVDDAGAPVKVPSYQPDTRDDEQRAEQARARIDVRARIEAEMSATEYTSSGTAPEATLRLLAAPSDINWGGKVHGGRIMHWIDEAAYVCAAQWTGQQVRSSYVAGIRFYRPILVGHVVEVTARLIHTGPRSLHLTVDVHHADPHDHHGAERAAHAFTVFVAPDPAGRPQPVPPWQPESDEDHDLDRHAQRLIDLRQLVSPFAAVDPPRCRIPRP